ncbi:helix-turn-helix domain-containing protein, partial [Seohaeicola sp. 4SK31]|uniref:helix-turn-helix domain-containing protein n=1 Tax=Seohaeicola sp. 4SK31 TaxID=3028386 RepID=UPI00237BD1CC
GSDQTFAASRPNVCSTSLPDISPSTPLTAEEIAPDCGKGHKRSTGVTPRVFSNMIRLERAVSAVVSSDLSFGALSDQLGFTAQAHFTRFFRDHTGVPPSSFRSISRLGDTSDFFRI